MKRVAPLLVLLALLCPPVWAKPADFWKLESEREGPTSAATFTARQEPARGQGILVCGSWPAEEGVESAPLEPSVVLAGLYKDLKDFHLLGRKEVTWGGRPARLVAFRATVEKRPVVARALLGQGQEQTHVLLLLCHPDALKDFRGEFDRLQKGWDFSRPSTANVIYSPGEAKPR